MVHFRPILANSSMAAPSGVSVVKVRTRPIGRSLPSPVFESPMDARRALLALASMALLVLACGPAVSGSPSPTADATTSAAAASASPVGGAASHVRTTASPVRTTVSPADTTDLVSTFSIVAFDPETGDLGVAVQSKYLAVGTVVPFAEAGVGAVATQSLANTTFGPRGLELLRAGNEPRVVLDRLLADDPQRGARQVGIIDASGRAATFTGDECLTWAGGRTGDNYSVQGNILAGPGVVDAMARAFEETAGDLATRMVAALAAGQAAGGDVRGRQSAALLVVREGGGYGGFSDRFIDLRVDDHETPIEELGRLLDLRRARLQSEIGAQAFRDAGNAREPQRTELLERAVAAFTEAARLDPDNGWHEMSLAAVHLARDDLAAAAAAGTRALQADPWVKTGILRGFGSLDVAEELLADADFRRAWEQIQVQYR